MHKDIDTDILQETWNVDSKRIQYLEETILGRGGGELVSEVKTDAISPAKINAFIFFIKVDNYWI